MNRKPGFYIVQHISRDKREVGEWYGIGDGTLGGYWLMPDSRNHFADAAFSFISEHAVDLNPPKEIQYHEWQQRELIKYAFPGQMMGLVGHVEQLIPTQGMSKREYFAAKAMQGMLANAEVMNHVNGFPDPLDVVAYTDRILKQLES